MHTTRQEVQSSRKQGIGFLIANNAYSLCSLGPCDVTKKEDLERIVKEVESKEKYINLLSK